VLAKLWGVTMEQQVREQGMQTWSVDAGHQAIVSAASVIWLLP
jgi:hypothetical protein